MCMERPKSFVIAKFAEAARLVFPEVVTLYYMIDRESREEYVVVEFKTQQNYGAGLCPQIAGGSFKICVSEDSNAAMIEDVWRELKRRFL